ncbi:DUF1803 domain-containing protein [Streptococcus ictaluri]|uniref:DUF1803 domain-containing protein n=1 Tax=Streptococcus ictaluri TaxID=380397 RepID=UPI000594D13F|nr:DUF1803 domain-containing protein [Streptococcus ictaluri]
MIKALNPNKLTCQPFFQSLINYLATNQEVTLRAIKKSFPHVKNVDRSIEAYVQANYILREEKRYYLNLPMLEQLDDLILDQQVFVETKSSAYQDLLRLRFETCLTNQTNQVLIKEITGFEREELTLANYFYRLNRQEPLSDAQKVLYDLLGDVNPQYALKYMTTFLMKYSRKTELMQKRRDIFVEALVLLGYITKNEAGKYELLMDFDSESLTFSSPIE